MTGAPRSAEASGAEGPLPGPVGLLGWWRSRGAATQAVVPGLYAWAVTVAPVALVRGATPLVMVPAMIGVASVVVAPFLERRWPSAAPALSGWGFVMSSIATWSFASEPVVASFDVARGVAGMFGWGLFAFAVAAPARTPPASRSELVPASKSRPPRGYDAAVIVVGVGLAVGLEIPGWQLVSRDRSLLIRAVALAGGVAVISLASAIAASGQRSRRGRGEPRRRLRASTAAWCALTLLLGVGGAAYACWHPGP